MQGDDVEFLDDVIQFTTKTIDDSKYHDIYDNLVDQPRDEDPLESIAEGDQDAYQIGVTAVENSVSNPISEILFHDHKWNYHHITAHNW